MSIVTEVVEGHEIVRIFANDTERDNWLQQRAQHPDQDI